MNMSFWYFYEGRYYNTSLVFHILNSQKVITPNKCTGCTLIGTIFLALGPFFLVFLCFQWKNVRKYWNVICGHVVICATRVWPLRTQRAPCVYLGVTYIWKQFFFTKPFSFYFKMNDGKGDGQRVLLKGEKKDKLPSQCSEHISGRGCHSLKNVINWTVGAMTSINWW